MEFAYRNVSLVMNNPFLVHRASGLRAGFGWPFFDPMAKRIRNKRIVDYPF